MQDYIESVHSLPEAGIQDLFHSKNIYAVIVRTKTFIKQLRFKWSYLSFLKEVHPEREVQLEII
jgi:hypothetical protein